MGWLAWHRVAGQTEGAEKSQVWGRHKGTDMVPYVALGSSYFNHCCFITVTLESVWGTGGN